MIKNIVLLTIFFYFLSIFQSSFFIHIEWIGAFPLLTLIFLVAILFLNRKKIELGLFGAAIAGLFLDLFSAKPFGFHVLLFLFFALLVNFVFLKYVRVFS